MYQCYNMCSRQRALYSVRSTFYWTLVSMITIPPRFFYGHQVTPHSLAPPFRRKKEIIKKRPQRTTFALDRPDISTAGSEFADQRKEVVALGANDLGTDYAGSRTIVGTVKSDSMVSWRLVPQRLVLLTAFVSGVYSRRSKTILLLLVLLLLYLKQQLLILNVEEYPLPSLYLHLILNGNATYRTDVGYRTYRSYRTGVR